MHHPTDKITHTTAFVTPVVEHWLEREIDPTTHRTMSERSTSELRPAPARDEAVKTPRFSASPKRQDCDVHRQGDGLHLLGMKEGTFI